MNLEFQLILVAHFLDGQVAFYILDFLADENSLILIADALAQKPCQRCRHKHNIFIFLSLCHPDNRIQCVIQKMRVDLGLKSFQFALSLQFLFVDILCHQIFNLMGHHIE